MDIIILSGGLGTRLRSVVNDRPKTMALVEKRPFLEDIFQHIERFEIKNIILAVGYKKEQIKQYFGNKYHNMNIIYSEETEPLGTGGAIKKALKKTKEEDVIVMYGDIYTRVNLQELVQKHKEYQGDVTFTIKEMENFDRFGIVEFKEDNRITKFREKQFTIKGYMNAGVYVIKNNIFNNSRFGEQFSLENEYFQENVNKMKYYAYQYDGEFVDIGIPEDYIRLNQMLEKRIVKC